jgi:ABC-type phosphate transport system substrate-binding protein
MKILKAVLPALVLVVGASRVEAQGSGFIIVVNEANPVTTVRGDELTKMYLKKITVWRTKQPVVAVDQAETTKIRQQFSRDVLHRDLQSVQSYWQAQIFSGRAVPPQLRASDTEVMAFVAANPNAIGYVTAGATLAPGVKALTIE